jgi:folylpolyglutamate synthase
VPSTSISTRAHIPFPNNKSKPTSGPTRKETSLSEARSYYNLAVANTYFGLLPSSSSDSNLLLSTSRILLEERALDSYYNILFSVISFWRHHAVWPDRLTIVSHGFKRNRLVDGHCAAIGFPLDRVGFVGIHPPGVDGMGGLVEEGAGPEQKAEAMRGVQLAMGQWAVDPHGVGEELAGKRRARNCWGVQQRLFWDGEERLRSGVDVRVLEDGSEALVEGGRRPWAAK